MNKEYLKSHLRKLEEQLLTINIRKSSNKISQLLADDFIEFGSSGQIFNKQQTISHLLHEDLQKRILKDFKLQLLEQNTAL